MCANIFCVCEIGKFTVEEWNPGNEAEITGINHNRTNGIYKSVNIT